MPRSTRVSGKKLRAPPRPLPRVTSLSLSLFRLPGFSFYIGETGRDLDAEALRWLTQRGSMLTVSGVNRPVLLHGDGRVVTMKQAKDDFGFSSFYVKDDFLDKVRRERFFFFHADGHTLATLHQANSTKLEAALQRKYQSLPLGRRLWRRVGAGSNGLHEPRDEREHKVFIAYSFEVSSAVADGRLKINH